MAIAQNAKAFDLHFIHNRSIKLKFFDSVSFLPCALPKLPEAYGFQAAKSWYPHYINTEENLDFVGSMLDIYYGVDDMCGVGREEFLAWYEERKYRLFHKKQFLEAYYQDDVTVLRQSCRFFRREFLQIGNIDVFLSNPSQSRQRAKRFCVASF